MLCGINTKSFLKPHQLRSSLQNGFDNSITDEEIEKSSLLCKKYNIELILQPKMNGNIPAVNSAFMEQTLDKCLAFYKHVRLIPQVHKFIDVH